MLLTLAREQKVDLTKISILQLADQYLAFIAAARQLRLEIAADYLVMAAWLAYLKSRLLLPEPQPADEPERRRAGRGAGPSAAAARGDAAGGRAHHGAAAARPRRLRAAARPRVCRESLRPVYEATLYDLLKAYGDSRQRKESVGVLHIAAPSSIRWTTRCIAWSGWSGAVARVAHAR